MLLAFTRLGNKRNYNRYLVWKTVHAAKMALLLYFMGIVPTTCLTYAYLLCRVKVHMVRWRNGA